MGAKQITVIVAGAKQVANALGETDQFGAVLGLNSTSELKQLITSNQLTPGVNDKLFIFSDAVIDDTTPNLVGLITKLTSIGGQVVVLASSPNGQAIVQQCPGAGLIAGDLTVNKILGGIAGLPGMEGLYPIDDTRNYPLSAAAEQAQTQPTFETPTNPFDGFQNSGNSAQQSTQDPYAAQQQPYTDPSAGQPYQQQENYGFGYADQAQQQNTGMYDQQQQYPQNTSQGGAWSTPPEGYNTETPFGGDDSWQGPAARAGAQTMQARKGKVIVVTAPKGGTGKSSLSLNSAALLGLMLKGQGKNVCLVDANLQQADAGKYVAAHTPSIIDLLADASQITPDKITNYLHHKPNLNFSILIGPPEPELAYPVWITGTRYAEIIEALKPNYDYIIVDTPVAEFYHELFRDFALPYADYLLVCIAPNNATIYNTYLWIKQITTKQAAGGAGFDPNKIGIVLNRSEDGIGCDEDAVADQLRDWDYIGAIPETKDWKKANNEHRLVVTENRPEINSALSLVLEKATGEHLTDAGTTAKLSAAGSTQGLFKRLFSRKGKN